MLMVAVSHVTDLDFVLKLIELVAVTRDQSLKLQKKSAVSQVSLSHTAILSHVARQDSL